MTKMFSFWTMITLGTIYSAHATTIEEAERHLQSDYQAAQAQKDTHKLDTIAQKIVLHCHRLYKNEGPHAGLGSSSDDQCIARLIGTEKLKTSPQEQ